MLNENTISELPDAGINEKAPSRVTMVDGMKCPRVNKVPISAELHRDVNQADTLVVGGFLLPRPAAEKAMPQLGGGSGVNRRVIGAGGANNRHGKHADHEDL